MLAEILGVEAGAKTRAQTAFNEAAGIFRQRPKGERDPLSGIVRTYKPKDEEGDYLPSEGNLVQIRAENVIKNLCIKVETLFNVTYSKEQTNCLARANIIVDGKVLLEKVPATYLLFLGRQLDILRGFVDHLPTLAAGEQWIEDETQDCWATKPHGQSRTQKKPKAFVKAAATEHHPAQVDIFTEDILVGYWTITKYSGALPATTVREMLDRVEKLQDAVKSAQHRANSEELITEHTVGGKILNYIFKH